ncbi:hypothetical protein [Streptomyces sp. WM6372]|uniref:hypothetical protein n=1 Tax=Streptomyces sp. WM6372 TaxID=1415555 RepID=UPI00131DDDB4|nr:hypothetical protein [Streptomyces sp. WM6372]
MGEAGDQVRLIGLTRLEVYELSEAFPSKDIEAAQEESLSGGQHGDLGTWQAILTLYAATLPVLTAWIVKRRRHAVMEIDVESADGSGWHRQVLKIDLRDSENPQSEAAQIISSLLQSNTSVEDSSSE